MARAPFRIWHISTFTRASARTTTTAPFFDPDGNSGPRVNTTIPPHPSPHLRDVGATSPTMGSLHHQTSSSRGGLSMDVLGLYEWSFIYLNGIFYINSRFLALPPLPLQCLLLKSSYRRLAGPTNQPLSSKTQGLLETTINDSDRGWCVEPVQSSPKSSVHSLTFRVASSPITCGFVIKTKTPTTSLKENGHLQGCCTMTLGLIQGACSVCGSVCTYLFFLCVFSKPFLWRAPSILRIWCRSIGISVWVGKESGVRTEHASGHNE